MSIAAISSSSVINQTSQPTSSQQLLSQLLNSIKSGDLDGAQKAYAAFTQAQSANGSTANPNSPLAQALNQIGQALQSGNIGGAQQALTSLQGQARGGHHDGHHHSGAANSTSGAATNSAAAQPSSAAVDIKA
jgi:hypothetical protein